MTSLSPDGFSLWSPKKQRTQTLRDTTDDLHALFARSSSCQLIISSSAAKIHCPEEAVKQAVTHNGLLARCGNNSVIGRVLSCTSTGRLCGSASQTVRGERGTFPREAVIEAIEQREAITPELLRVLEYARDNIEDIAERPDYFAHI